MFYLRGTEQIHLFWQFSKSALSSHINVWNFLASVPFFLRKNLLLCWNLSLWYLFLLSWYKRDQRSFSHLSIVVPNDISEFVLYVGLHSKSWENFFAFYTLGCYNECNTLSKVYFDALVSFCKNAAFLYKKQFNDDSFSVLLRMKNSAVST